MSKIQTLDLKIIDLTAARDTVRLDITRAGYQGFFADYRTNGEALLHINESAYSGFPIKAQVGLAVGINELFITNAAQPGKTLYLWLSKDATFLQANQDITSIGTVDLISAITPPSLVTPYWASLISTALQTIVTPAANTAGIKVLGCGCYGLGGHSRFMAKSSAPSGTSDAAAHTLGQTVSIVAAPHGNETTTPVFPIIIPAGLGFYFQSNNIAQQQLWAEYEVL